MTNRTIGPRETLGVAIIALGVFAFLSPGASQQVADAFEGDALAILTATIWATGVLVALAGLAVLLGRNEAEE